MHGALLLPASGARECAAALRQRLNSQGSGLSDQIGCDGGRWHRAGDQRGDGRGAARGRPQVWAGLAVLDRLDRARGAAPAGHHLSGGRPRGGAGRRRRHPGPGVAQRLSAGRRGRAQSVGRAAQAARSVRQYPPGAHPRRLSAALRHAGRSGDRAREHRRLLRRPLDVPGPGRVHADPGSRARGAQDHAGAAAPGSPRWRSGSPCGGARN